MTRRCSPALLFSGLALLVAGLLLLPGCSGEPKSGGDSSAATSGEAAKPGETGASTAAASGENKSKGKTAAEVLPGQWILWMTQLSERPAEIPLILVDFKNSEEDGTLQGRTVETSSAMPESTMVQWHANGDDVKLVIKTPVGLFDFEGKLRNNVFWGNFKLQGTQIVPARLIAATEASLKGVQPNPLDGWSDFQPLLKDQDPADFKKFAETHPQSVLAMVAHNFVLGNARQLTMSEEDVDQLGQKTIETAGNWGRRYAAINQFRFGVGLVQMELYPELGLKYLQQLEEKKLPEGLESLAPQISLIGDRMQASQAAKTAASGDEQARQEAAEQLEKLGEKHEYDPLIQLDVASFYEQTAQVDKAIERYGRLAAIPSLESFLAQLWQDEEPKPELPSNRLARLWRQKHGNDEGVPEYLDGLFRGLIEEIADEPVPARPPGEANRVALWELFTGATCPPCVAPDVALGAVEATYEQSEMIALRYHQHIPMPSPLVNNDSEARFAYYNLQGTPMLFLNGVQVEGAAGGVDRSASLYHELKRLSERFLLDQTEVNIELSAKVEGSQVAISAKATGLPADTTKLRMRMALAEDEISFLASNGVRLHEMVVRSMPGGPGGIAAVGGEFKFSETISMDKVRERLQEYLTSVEPFNPAGPFTHKPMEMQNMHLVAFVQNDETREVLQAASIPLDEFAAPPAPSAPADTPAGEKPSPGPDLTPPAAPEKAPQSEQKPKDEEKSQSDNKPEEKPGSPNEPAAPSNPQDDSR